MIPYVLSHSEVLEWHQDRLNQLDNASVAKTHFEIEEPPVWKPSTEFSSGKLEYTSGLQLIFGSLETLIEHLPDLEKITVGRYTAKRGGKDTTIRSYIKCKPTRRSKIQDRITNHIVYKVYDHKDKLHYIGEGLPNRPDHVFLGDLHNPKINKHFFTQKKPMRVDIVSSGLTKSDALAIESVLLFKHRQDELWNSKDYYREEMADEKTHHG